MREKKNQKKMITNIFQKILSKKAQVFLIAAV